MTVTRICHCTTYFYNLKKKIFVSLSWVLLRFWSCGCGEIKPQFTLLPHKHTTPRQRYLQFINPWSSLTLQTQFKAQLSSDSWFSLCCTWNTALFHIDPYSSGMEEKPQLNSQSNQQHHKRLKTHAVLCLNVCLKVTFSQKQRGVYNIVLPSDWVFPASRPAVRVTVDFMETKPGLELVVAFERKYAACVLFLFTSFLVLSWVSGE